MERGDWWATFFEGTALELWRRAFTRDETRGQAGDIARTLDLQPSERVLDVPCGNARLALELAASGFQLAGLDRSEPLLREAHERAAERGLELDLRRGDMRALPWREEFDAAFCAGNSFGYFDEEGDLAFLRSVARALVPKGRLLLEYPLVAELVRARRGFRDWRILGDRVLLTEGFHDEERGRMTTTYTFLDLGRAGGAIESRTASYAVRSAEEVEQLLRRAGFENVERLGALDGSAFGPEAEEFHVRAVRA